jgi:hypothetical protein
MKPSLVLSASFVLFLVTAAPAVAQIQIQLQLPILHNLLFSGKYGVTGTAICNQLKGTVSTVGTLTTSGTYTFNGDGTGSATETAVTSVQGAIGSTGSNNHTFTFRYTVNGDGSFTLTTDPGSLTGTIVSGPNAGLTFSVDELAPITGFVGSTLEILSGATLESPIETTTLSNGAVSTRRCQRSPVFLKL